MLVLIMAMAAFVIDVGALYRERQELQNGADAAALAVAQSCADPDEGCNTSHADEYADSNASDGDAAVDDVCIGHAPGDCGLADPGDAAGWVQVTTSTDNGNGGSEVSYFFGPVFEAFGSTVRAKATAVWGPPRRASGIPLTISECEFGAAGGSTDGTPSAEVFIYFHNTVEAEGSCGGEPSGSDAPGGFGWLEADPKKSCNVTVTEDGTASADTGNSQPKEMGCDDEFNHHLATGEPMALPLYRSVSGTGDNTVYEIAGFTGFVLTGYFFGEGNPHHAPSDFECELGNGSSSVCLRGYFTGVVADGDGAGTGKFGAIVVSMID